MWLWSLGCAHGASTIEVRLRWSLRKHAEWLRGNPTAAWHVLDHRCIYRCHGCQLPLPRVLPPSSARVPAVSRAPTSPLPPTRMQPLPLSDVRLLDTALQARYEKLNAKYLLDMLEPDRLLWSFRKTSGLPTPGTPYIASWEDPGCELRGHFVGHYLSALSLALAGTGGCVKCRSARCWGLDVCCALAHAPPGVQSSGAALHSDSFYHA